MVYNGKYQSGKYTAQTAVSEPVTVTLQKEMTFEVKQTSTKEFTLNFSTSVKTLANADVTVTRMLNTYEYPQVIQSVTLAKDGMSASVKVFNPFANGVKYVIKVKDYEDGEMIASVGRPVRMELVAKDKNPSFVLTTKEPAEILCKFYDAADVDVTDTVTDSVRFTLEKQSPRDYYLAGNKLTITNNTATPVVIAEYPGWIENGKRVGGFKSQPTTFVAQDAAVDVPVAVRDYKVQAGWGDGDWKKTFQKSQSAKLEVKLDHSSGKGDNNAYTNGTVWNSAKSEIITFTALNPEICVVDSSGNLKALQVGTASFYVNLKSAKGEVTPFAVVSVEIKADSVLDTIKAGQDSITIGLSDAYHTGAIEILGYDQYGSRMNVPSLVGDKSNLTVECISEGYGNKATFAGIMKGFASVEPRWDGKNKINFNVDAKILCNAMDESARPKNGNNVALYFVVKYAGKTTEFAVTIQSLSASTDNYITVEAPATIDVLRTYSNDGNNNTEKEKVVEFKVYTMNNGVKVSDLGFDQYPADGVLVKDNYYYKVFRNGEEFKGALVQHDNGTNVVTVHPSYIETLSDRVLIAVSGSAVANVNPASGSAVTYKDAGEGSYSFVLYKASSTSEADQVAFGDTAVTVGDAGQYAISGNQKSNKVEVNAATGDQYSITDAKKILKCFAISDRGGNSIFELNGEVKAGFKDLYYVNYTAVAGTSSVYVEEIIFFEKVADNVYVQYVIPMKVSLEAKIN